MPELSRSLLFCLTARSVDEARRDKLDHALAVTAQELRETDDRAKMTKSLGQLASLAEEIDALPVRD